MDHQTIRTPDNTEESGTITMDIEDAPATVKPNRTCRLCLLPEEDSSRTFSVKDPLIVPCFCTNDRKFVHVSCLEHWRIYQKPSEFRQCGECGFNYHLLPRVNNGDSGKVATSSTSGAAKSPVKLQSPLQSKARMLCAILFDFTIVNVIIQGLMVGAGYLIWVLDAQKTMADSLSGNVDCRRNITMRAIVEGDDDANFYCTHMGSLYYIIGALVIIILGGLIYICCAGCDFFCHENEDNNDEENPLPTRRIHATSHFYRKRYERRQQRVQSNNFVSMLLDGCCFGPCARKLSRVYEQLVYDIRLSAHTAFHYKDDSRNHSRSSEPKNDSGFSVATQGFATCLFMLFLGIVFFFVMPVIFLVGFMAFGIMYVIITRRIIHRHVHVMHRRRLVQQFAVVDLAPLCRRMKKKAMDALEEQRPRLTDADMHSLQKLGIVEDDVMHTGHSESHTSNE